MLKIAYDSIYQHPLPKGHRFPMLKYELIPQQLIYEGTITEANLFSPKLLDEPTILRTHDAEYWRKLKNLELTRKEIRATGFPLSAELVQREIMIAKGTIDCALYAQQFGISMNIAGGTHHAFSNRGEGFCLLNDFGIAANYLLDNDLAQSILIIDLDVHQGNGTAEIFRNESRVFTFSMHGANNYPLRKEQSDLDIGLPDKANDELFLSTLYDTLPGLIDNLEPDFIFYLSGVDILETDKLGRLGVSMEGCKKRDKFVFEQCLKSEIPVAVSMGGGYSTQIAHIINAHSNTFRLAQKMFF
ncbi:MAG: acetoin utilization deacetylase AcuC-like enzyme [Cognaticolwellia sp.]|jgi:acetoin utilization deacetylase AcuC-like enzyme